LIKSKQKIRGGKVTDKDIPNWKQVIIDQINKIETPENVIEVSYNFSIYFLKQEG